MTNNNNHFFHLAFLQVIIDKTRSIESPERKTNVFTEAHLKTAVMYLGVLEAVRQNPQTCRASDAELERIIQRWLRFACDRSGGRQRRAARAAESQQ